VGLFPRELRRSNLQKKDAAALETSPEVMCIAGMAAAEQMISVLQQLSKQLK
jgi:hypothetical protein